MTTRSDTPIALRKRLDQKVRGFMLHRGLWPQDGPLLLAVSGGPDSSALLLLLARLAPYQGAELHVAYFDHGLRGPEASEVEATTVSRLCDRLGLPFMAGSGDVRGRVQRDGLSIEDAARRERYEFLARTARVIGAGAVATGHTASDQAETVLMHLVRGAGLDGLAGMAPDASWPLPGGEGLSLVRPLLCLSREETAAYCKASDVQPVDDESNASPDHTRNRIRNELLPLLRTFNPKVEDALVRLADAAREAPPVTGSHDGALSRMEPEMVSPEAVRQAISGAVGSLQGFSARNVADIQRLLLHGDTGDAVDLPRGLRAALTREEAVIEPRAAGGPSLPDGEAALQPEIPTIFGHLWLRMGQGVMAEADAVAEVDAAAAADLRVRRRAEGDRFQPLGMQDTRKLQDFFVDAHVPREARDGIPVFLGSRGILWVGGLRIAHWARPRPGHPTVWLSYRAAIQG